MCPLYPLHIVVLYLCMLLPLLFAVVHGSDELFSRWSLKFLPGQDGVKLGEGNTTGAQFQCMDCPLDEAFKGLQVALVSDNPDVVGLEHQIKEDASIADEETKPGQAELVYDLAPLYADKDSKSWTLSFNLTGEFVGMTRVRAQLRDPSKASALVAETDSQASLSVSVVKKKTIWSKLFGYSVGVLISLAYINMGCAMDLTVVRETIRRPIGPVIGFLCQYLIMPLISFALGYAFYESPAMRLGLFVTGCSPGGGASNIWTLMFGGNLNLSLTMTALSTFAAFGMMPLWLFSLGQLLFVEHDIVIPYHKICTYAICLVVPLGIGLLLQKKTPRVSAFLVRALKPVALFLIMFILVFGIWANFWMFKLMTWKVWLTGMALPWLGFAFGCTLARVSGRPAEDVIAIAVETGVQNTGVSIFMLWFTFDHPLGDLAAVVPVAVATMTPFPLLCSLIYMKLRSWAEGRKRLPGSEEEASTSEETGKLDAERCNDVDFPQSESTHKLMPIVKTKNGIGRCPLAVIDSNGNI